MKTQKTEIELRQKYLIEKPRRKTLCFIIQHEGDPIGYLQYYRLSDEPQWLALVSGLPHDYRLDLFIGMDELLLGKGREGVYHGLRKAEPFDEPNADTTPRRLSPMLGKER